MPLNDLEVRLIALLQSGIDVTERPFRLAAEALGSDENTVIQRLQALLDSGALSRFGPMFNAEALGGAYSLCAMSVPQDRFEEVTESVNSFQEVAHNYERDHTLNMWFVIAAETPEGVGEVIAAIEDRTGLPVLDFPKEEEYFIGLQLPIGESAESTLERARA